MDWEPQLKSGSQSRLHSPPRFLSSWSVNFSFSFPPRTARWCPGMPTFLVYPYLGPLLAKADKTCTVLSMQQTWFLFLFKFYTLHSAHAIKKNQKTRKSLDTFGNEFTLILFHTAKHILSISCDWFTRLLSVCRHSDFQNCNFHEHFQRQRKSREETLLLLLTWVTITEWIYATEAWNTSALSTHKIPISQGVASYVRRAVKGLSKLSVLWDLKS